MLEKFIGHDSDESSELREVLSEMSQIDSAKAQCGTTGNGTEKLS